MDKFDAIGLSLLRGDGCAGGVCSAADIGDAIREAVKAERAACAKIVEKLAGADIVYPAGLQLLVDAIRARSNDSN